MKISERLGLFIDGQRVEAAVQSHHTRLQPFRDPQAFGHIAGVDIADEPVLGVVGLGDGVVGVVEGDDRCHRTENLLLQDVGIGGHVHQDRRREEEADAVLRPTPGDQLRPLRHGIIDKRRHVGTGSPVSTST